jgi:hypothetical protein
MTMDGNATQTPEVARHAEVMACETAAAEVLAAHRDDPHPAVGALRSLLALHIEWHHLQIERARRVVALLTESLTVDELAADLERRADACDTEAEECAVNGESDDARHSDGKAQAYRHAADLVRAALAREAGR